MNYNSIEEILASGTTNMTVIRNNSKQDDGVDTMQGVSWFSYDGTVANTIYVSGNSYIGFGSDITHLQVNNRDGAMWYLYREEGTLYDYYKFLKIRWQGYTYYNKTTSTYLLTYDVILWDTGDISIHIVNYPSQYNTGTYKLGSTSYTVNASKPDVTFRKTDSGFTLENSIITIANPAKLYLVRSGSNYYTVSNGSLSNIGNIELTASNFKNYAVEEIPDISLLSNLSNPELVFWHPSSSLAINKGLVISIDVSLPQVVYYENQSIPSGTHIDIVETSGANNALFAISFDNGATWKYYNGTEWVTAQTTSEGMTADVLNGISKAVWATAPTASVVQFRCSLMTLDATAGKIAVGYS